MIYVTLYAAVLQRKSLILVSDIWSMGLRCSRSVSFVFVQSHFPSLHWNEVNFYPPKKPKSIPTTPTKSTRKAGQSILTLKPRHSWWDTKLKSFSGIHTETKSISIPPQKPSHFWSTDKNQANFDHPHNNQVKTDPQNKHQVIFGLNTKNEVNFDHPCKKAN